MQDYIKPESKIMQIFYKATECMLLSILWVVTSLPVITIGASTTALYYAVVKVIRNNEGYVWGEFWNGFRTNFKQATIIWLVALLLLAGAAADIVVVYVLSAAGRGSMKVWYRAIAPKITAHNTKVSLQAIGIFPYEVSRRPAMNTRTPCPNMVARR